jgi:hypothetical protein
MPGHPPNHLKEFLVTLARHEVDFIVCGGVAAILHGVPRITLDLDIAIDWSEPNIRRLITAMEALSLKPKMPIPADALLRPGAVEEMREGKKALVFTFRDPEDTLRHIDVFLTKELSYTVLKDHVRRHSLEGAQINVLEPRYLLMLKESIDPPRDKDLLDIKTLRKLVEQEDEGL